MEVHNWEQDLNLAKGWVAELNKLAPQEMKHEAYSTIAKIPFKVAAIKEIFLYRVVDLSKIAIELIDKNKCLAAAILIRSTMETTAMLYYIYNKMKLVVEKNDVGDIDEYLMRVTFGCKEQEDLAKPINVLTAIQKVDKWLNKGKPESAKENTKNIFMGFYDALSDYTHPNWWGALGAYGEVGAEFMSLKCATPNIPISEVVAPLAATLSVFKYVYMEINNLMKAFIKTCENDLKE